MRELLGRSADLDALGELLGRADGAVVLHGEAGVGKTAVAVRALEQVPHRAGGALGTLSWLPYLPLRRALPELPGPTWSGDADYVAAAVAAALGPQLLLVEDLHWTDPGSLDAVEQLVGTVPLLATVRRGDPAAADVVARLEKAGAVRVDLEPLDPRDARALVDRVCPGLSAAQADNLARRSGGNPLLVEELAAGGATTPPPSLELALLARCRRLPDAHLEGLALLALAGQPLPPEVLPDPAGLVESGLAVVRDGEATIRHALIGEVLGGLLSQERLVRCHRALAGLLRHPGEQARHLLAAGDRAAAHEAALRAVDGSTTSGEQWRHLAVAAESADGDRAEELRIRASELACAAAEPVRAGELLEGLEVAGPHGAALALARATQAFQVGEWDRYRDELARGRRLAVPGSAEHAALRAREATAANIIDGDARRALVVAREAIALAGAAGTSAAGPRATAASALATLGEAGWRELFAEAIDEAGRDGDVYRELNARHNLVVALTAAGALEEALTEATRQEERCRELRLLKRAHSAEVARLVVAGYRGDVGLVEREVGRLLGEALGPADLLDAISVHGFLLAEQGRSEAALAAAERLRGAASHTSNHHAIRASALAAAGHPGPALEELALFAECSGSDDYALTELAPVAAWAAWELGRPVTEPAHPMVGGLFAGCEPEVAGIRALAERRHDDARRHFERAARDHGERRPRVLMCRWAMAEADRLAGHADAAEALLRRVHEEAAIAGFAPVVTRCERSLRSLGVRTRRGRPSEDGSALSARERQVVDLVVEGLTDRDIAARLGVAHRTVQSHVASARRKLGADNRSHLAALAGPT